MSTTDLMVYMQEKLARILTNKEHAVVLFFDLAKAFDTLNHKILEEKLIAYGITGTALKLLKSYLSNRSQKVKVNGILSEVEAFTIVVPQGSTEASWALYCS